LADVFTERRGQRTPDPDWIRHAARNGLVIFTKDDRLLVEHRRVIRSVKAKLFVLSHAGLAGTVQLERYVEHRYRIARAARKAGPLAYRLYPKVMNRVHL
jgi:hypothetical protein